ncbi:MAG: hypothetical protein G8D61_12980 [gamma proteobacterium symbiont of Ctena orbiculata]|nr:hypothetical protein [Candidatus Thiodiazotropha taylori]MBT3057646.1 hypothetical protein [Candidatus Thiodiazotropha sp. (ex Lucina pensylvanica)]MBT3064621.1 hypothetical protein [Candidatus Thiodiazotropha sp. (ex Lucina pensylvanica)]PUB72346.1 MAG: hypothetical protein DBP03_17625 [gamma proteobacterium symbiont of Ctena orbiculata]PUB74926.1 MAG: hypothetical protein DBO99_17375 [gamma proteobacterium symbiont of Ctena orbiculata]
MKRTVLALAFLVAGCSESVDVEFFSYQGCRRDMTEAFTNQGMDPVAANMKAKAHCEEQMQK